MFSLRTIIDDILLLVRNNNISESEDLSRDQIASWVISYKAYLTKKEQDKAKEVGEGENSDSLQSTIGPLALQPVFEGDEDESSCIHKKRTKEKIPTLLGDSQDDIVCVRDKYGCTIQFMSENRRHYHYFRRYTYGEPTCYYEDGYLYIDGYGIDDLDVIYIEGNFAEDPGAESEDDILIPGHMIPEIKKAIMTNELNFMLKRPSDDSNNSTLASVKPHGPQDQEQ